MFCSLPESTSDRPWAERGLALFDGARFLAGAALIGDAFRSLLTPDASLLGIFLRGPGGAPLPAVAGLILGAAFLRRLQVSAFILATAGVLAIINVGEFYVLRAGGLDAAFMPFSFLTLALLAGATARSLSSGPIGRWRWMGVGAGLSAPAVLLLHLFSFGATDYARRADAIVVFGAKAYKDGTPSLALYDRVAHGIRLYQDGAAPVIVMSGAPDETPVMKRMAIEAGVPRAAVEEDPAGLNTYGTIKNLSHRRVVAVSHYYHLARIKMTAQRHGIVCYTSPCPMSRRLAKEPWFIARECAAFGAYYLFRG